MPYLAQAALLADVDFMKRLKLACVHIALDVNGEASSTLYHDSRATLALKMLHDPEHWHKVLAPGVVAGDTITSASLDADIYNRISAVFNDYALIHGT